MVVRWKPVIFPAKILLATDGSEEATLAAQSAADLAARTGSELHVTHVGETLGPGYSGYAGYEEGVLPSAQEDLERQAQEALEAQVGRIAVAEGPRAQSHLRMGRPDEEIVALGEEIGAELIVIGSRGLGGVRRALMGSVSDSVVRHAHCPVLVVRREGRQEPV
jgi:nucleotide-binding universal stress UspA family protein